MSLAESAVTSATEVESFTASGSGVERQILRRSGAVAATWQDTSSSDRVGLRSQFLQSWLRSRDRPRGAPGAPVTIVDLFAGCGGLSLGVEEACRSLGLGAQTVLAADTNEVALSVLLENFEVGTIHHGGVEELVDRDPGDVISPAERRLRRSLDGLDLLIGGPPCQGHSDLNNHTRRADPKNALYLRMARFAEVVRPRSVLVENVPGVAHDKRGVVKETEALLRSLGYSVTTGVLQAHELGGAQARRRHVLLAHRDHAVSVEEARAECAAPPETLAWAISDLSVRPATPPFDTPAKHSTTNQSRIEYLFENDLYNLPDSERPDCHRLKPHSYTAVYGRMHPDRPAPTITSGFGSTGQGRFVHPYEPRTLTPHEAARLQGFPDWFDFASVEARGALQQMIGNAVPSRLSYAAALHLLR